MTHAITMAKTVFAIVLMIVVMLYGVIFLLVGSQLDKDFYRLSQRGINSHVAFHKINASFYFVNVKKVLWNNNNDEVIKKLIQFRNKRETDANVYIETEVNSPDSLTFSASTIFP